MESKQLSANPPERWCLVFAPADDVLSTLEEFVRERSIASASFQAIGAFRRATIAWFDLERRQYLDLEVDEQVEVSALMGNVARLADDGSPRLHAHVTLGRRDGTALAGHLRSAEVRPTLEMFLTVEEAPIERRQDEATGLPLLVP